MAWVPRSGRPPAEDAATKGRATWGVKGEGGDDQPGERTHDADAA